MNVVEFFALAIGGGTKITKVIVANTLMGDHQNYVPFHRDDVHPSNKIVTTNSSIMCTYPNFNRMSF
jgi:hypothetical protein